MVRPECWFLWWHVRLSSTSFETLQPTKHGMAFESLKKQTRKHLHGKRRSNIFLSTTFVLCCFGRIAHAVQVQVRVGTKRRTYIILAFRNTLSFITGHCSPHYTNTAPTILKTITKISPTTRTKHQQQQQQLRAHKYTLSSDGKDACVPHLD